MLNRDERIAQFLNVITQDESDRRERAKKEIESQCRREVEKNTKAVKQQSQAEIARRKSKLLSENGSLVNRERKESVRRLTSLRESLTESVFADARDRLLAFTQSKEYGAFLERSAAELAKHLPNGETVLYVAERDLVYSQRLTSAFGRPCAVEPDNTVLLGGCKAVCAEKAIAADDTLDSRLLASREWFLEISGLSVR